MGVSVKKMCWLEEMANSIDLVRTLITQNEFWWQGSPVMDCLCLSFNLRLKKRHKNSQCCCSSQEVRSFVNICADDTTLYECTSKTLDDQGLAADLA